MSLFDKLNKAKEEKLAANLKAGEEFLEKNKQRPEVHTTPSGLQYEVLKEGSGPKPKANDKVKCHYHGTLIDGTIFDSSVQRGQPATFPLNMVIKGWTEALQLMPVGSKYRLFLHPNLAYGERQTGSVIGPNSTLIFDVELLGIG
jgi:FKBP-type peptidyl-prolyl cis-trans isomerase FklB